MGICQLAGVLFHINLFHRNHARGQTRGTEGLSDLQAALGLVAGGPFTGQRGRGSNWLAEDVRVDQLLCAVVDVAYTVTIVALRSGGRQLARSVAGRLCSPPHTWTRSGLTVLPSLRQRLTGKQPNACFETRSATAPRTVMPQFRFLRPRVRSVSKLVRLLRAGRRRCRRPVPGRRAG